MEPKRGSVSQHGIAEGRGGTPYLGRRSPRFDYAESARRITEAEGHRSGRPSNRCHQISSEATPTTGDFTGSSGTTDEEWRIIPTQNEEKWIANLKAYLQGNLADLTVEEAKACSTIADDYEVDDDGLVLWCSDFELTSPRYSA
ncbi:unnamed protein product [Phytophthora fragariaefolia]|uniref:Unnamed protein product n=1 Tax=Phytophthora fragariaefolia TaxID=1490495 RepID=A0A9W7D8Z7_9STRA|nr:unnamed protein product [Phytophthora fragariaefolia]